MKGGDRIYLSEEQLRALRERLLQDVVVEGEVDNDWRLKSGEFLRGATFIFAAWTPPPPDWVSVSRSDDGRISAVSIRHEPGPPGWAEHEPAAWDHDHCALCVRHLSDDSSYGDELSGSRTGKNWGSYTWVCAQCFSEFESRLDWKRR